ncbi:MAG: hypothetical protein Q9222_007937, partial [Ikaeria aurantiellina]
ECIIPWRLRLLATRLQALGSGDRKRGVQGLYDLAFYARARVREGRDTALWKERLEELGVVTVNALVEMGDLAGARGLLESLSKAAEGEEERKVLGGAIAMVAIRMGDLDMARRWVEGVGGANGMLEPLLIMASGDYETAVTQWRHLIASDPKPEITLLARQNLAVCLLYIGRVDEATEILNTLITENHINSALTFNLATIYELTSDRAGDKKMELVERVMAIDGGTELGLGRGDFKL